MSDALPEVRVGDRERQAVDTQLQAALADGVITLTEYDERAGACWAARTQRDLEPLVADLPTQRRPASLPATPTAGPRRVTAVMSQSDFSGSVVPGQEVVAKALMGTVDVDLRRDDLPDVVHVRATAVMGEVKVHVPPGTTVHLSGLAVMGERKDRTGTPSASGAVVHVHASAVMGTVNVDDASRPGGPLPAQRGGSVPERHRSPRRRVVRSLIAAALVVGAGYGVEQVATAGDGSALFGSSVVTVRGQHDVHVGTAFGSVKVVVPDGAHVRTTGRVLFGSIDCPTACATPGTGASDVVVHAGGGFGSVEVETATEAQADH